ncbi:Hypothetical protein CINCED_3A012497 [Cinara cedri]|uniref:Uncharacterized protein n=1 Tax=Cinara cedri TaxID=506608 RepID=A0A5E4MYJ7_9HEMI|nr:Hypothetical protein CINCED_3A012497 [Cinara cedri]
MWNGTDDCVLRQRALKKTRHSDSGLTILNKSRLDTIRLYLLSEDDRHDFLRKEVVLRKRNIKFISSVTSRNDGWVPEYDAIHKNRRRTKKQKRVFNEVLK